MILEKFTSAVQVIVQRRYQRSIWWLSSQLTTSRTPKVVDGRRGECKQARRWALGGLAQYNIGMLSHSFEENRAKIPLSDLLAYSGQWVAFSLDGSRILAGAETLLELEKRLIARGEDPQKVGFEKIILENSSLGGAEFF
jgi:hypothetical protein